MSKPKIKLKDQTKKLSEAKWELLKRNDEKLKEFEENELIKSYRAFHKKWQNNNIGDCDSVLKESMVLPAVTEGQTIGAWIKTLLRIDGKPCEYDELNLLWKNQILEDAPAILDSLIPSGIPSETLIVSIDLTKPKKTILAELSAIIVEKKEVLAKERPIKKTRTVLPAHIDELMQVWDFWNKEGQKPWQRSFKAISRKCNGRKLSTVKSQWYKAYELVNDKAYNSDDNFTTEAKKRKADALCVECPYNAKCYGKSGNWIPCADYNRIAGREFFTTRKLERYSEGDLEHNTEND